MLKKKTMIVLDVADMPYYIREAIQERYHFPGQNTAIFFDIPTPVDTIEFGYDSDSDNEQRISKYLVSEGIKPGTEVLIHYSW